VLGVAPNQNGLRTLWATSTCPYFNQPRPVLPSQKITSIPTSRLAQSSSHNPGNLIEMSAIGFRSVGSAFCMQLHGCIRLYVGLICVWQRPGSLHSVVGTFEVRRGSEGMLNIFFVDSSRAAEHRSCISSCSLLSPSHHYWIANYNLTRIKFLPRSSQWGSVSVQFQIPNQYHIQPQLQT
jgi:hypothetical protein